MPTLAQIISGTKYDRDKLSPAERRGQWDLTDHDQMDPTGLKCAKMGVNHAESPI